MIKEIIAKMQAGHFIAVIAAFFLSSAIMIFLLDPFASVFEEIPASATIFAFALEIAVLCAISYAHFHFSRQDAEGIAAAYGLLGLWQMSNGMMRILLSLMASTPEEYGAYLKLAVTAGAAISALAYAGIMFVILWYVLPKNDEKR